MPDRMLQYRKLLFSPPQDAGGVPGDFHRWLAHAPASAAIRFKPTRPMGRTSAVEVGPAGGKTLDGHDGPARSLVSVEESALARLAESEARLRLATEAAAIGIWTWDLRTDDVFLTDECLAVMGLQQRPRTSDAFRASVHPEDSPILWATLRRSIEDHMQVRAEFRVVQPDGRQRWLLNLGRADYEGEEPVRLLGILQDITEQKLAQAALEAAQRQKDDFMAMVGHELRNFLAPVQNSVAILARAGDDPRRSAMATAMLQRHVGNLTRLVGDMLDVSRINSGKLDIQLERAGLADLVQRAAEMAAPGLRDKSQVLALEVEQGIEVFADPVRFCQALGNLLLNSVRYTPAGGHVVLRASCSEGIARVEVSDDGIGMEKDALDRVFGLYAQAGSSRSGGLGIGLHLVRTIVQMHGGSIEAHSAGPGLGSSFVIRMPVAPAG